LLQKVTDISGAENILSKTINLKKKIEMMSFNAFLKDAGYYTTFQFSFEQLDTYTYN